MKFALFVVRLTICLTSVLLFLSLPRWKLLWKNFATMASMNPLMLRLLMTTLNRVGSGFGSLLRKGGDPFPPSQLNQAVQPPSVGIRIVEPVPLLSAPVAPDSQPSFGKGKDQVVVEQQPLATTSFVAALSIPAFLPAQAATGAASSSRTLETVVLLGLDVGSPAVDGTSPNSVVDVSDVFSSPAVTPGDDAMEHDGIEDFFLEFADLEELVVSSDSLKKRKLEEGDEFSSPFLP